MPIQLDADLPAPLIPLAWLVGHWAGAGVVGYPTIGEDVRFGQELSFSHDGRPFLAYASRTWLLDDDGRQVRPLASETGYWRPGTPLPGEHAEQGGGGGGPAGGGGSAGEAGSGMPLEVLLAHPTGYVELYHGTADGPRVTLETDAVVRSRTAKEYTAATRMYGLVEGDLLWVMDMAAVGVPLRSHASARLKRVPAA